MKQADERAEYESAIAVGLQQAGLAPAGPSGPEFAGDDIADDITTAATLAVGQTLSSSIQSGGDKDYFRITLQAGHTYTLQMLNPGAGGVTDPFIEIRNSAGTLVDAAKDVNDDGGLGQNSFLVVRPQTTGTYYVVARAFEREASQGTPLNLTGNYTLVAGEITHGSTTPTTLPDTGKPSFSADEAAIQLSRDGFSWGTSFGAPITVTYAFRATEPTTKPEDITTWQRFNADQIVGAERALQAWGQVANINFVRVGVGPSGEQAYSDNAAILFNSYSSPSSGTSGLAYSPSSGDQSAGSVQGDVWINIALGTNSNPGLATQGYGTLLHEIGHALGLRHPGDYNGAGASYAASAEYREDSQQFTVMSYFQPTNTGAVMSAWSQMPAIHDIAAIQRLYGANMSTRSGDTTYGFNNNTGLALYGVSNSQSMYFTIWDGGGNDTLDASGYPANLPSTIDLREESFSSLGPFAGTSGISERNVSIARGAVIENAIGGAGNDVIIGNAAANRLQGGAGQDTLTGGLGADTILGGDGNDFIRLFAGDFVAGETIDGGAGGNALVVFGAAHDLRGGTIQNIARIDFERVGNEPTLNVMINNSQISVAGISAGLTLAGSAGQDSIQVMVPSGSVMNLQSWVFDPSWEFQDYVVSVGEGGGTENYIGWAGLDIFFAGGGDDIMDGRGAVDFAAYIFSLDGVTADLAQVGPQFISNHQGRDAFINIEGLAGSQLADTLYGDNGANFVLGIHGDDTLFGRGGDDDVRGGEHADRIEGGMGADTLWGEAPVETLSGPAGADTFVYRNAAEGGDSIRDFQAGVDKIEVSAAGFGGGLTAGGAVSLVANGSPSASGAGGQFLYNTGNGELRWDADGAGAGAATLLATLTTRPNLTAADFVVSGIGGTSAGVEAAEQPQAKTDADPIAEVSVVTSMTDDAFNFGGGSDLELDAGVKAKAAPVAEASVDAGAGPELAGDDIADDITTTNVLTVGGQVISSVGAGDDKDFFRVTLQGGRAYVLEMVKTPGNALDPYVKWHSSTGAQLGDNDDGGILTNSLMVMRPDATGTYYVSAQSFTGSGQTATTGGYTLSLREIPRGSTSPTDLGATTKPSYSWDEAAIQLTRNGHSWANNFGTAATVTYGFRATTTSTIPTESNGFQRFNAEQIQAAEQSLQAWAAVANITLVRVGTGTTGEQAYTDNAAILFGNYTVATTSTTSGQAFLPSTGNQAANSVEGDVWINISNTNNVNPIANPTGFGTLTHEIGHALGLHHPAEYNGGSPTYAADAIYREDSNQFTVMSYFPPSTTGAVMTGWSQMPALQDIAAIQRLYGANMSTRTGNDTYGFNNSTGLTIYGPSVSNSMYFTIWDAGGNDTLDLSGYSATSNTIDLREEGYSSAGLQVQSGSPAKWNINIARGAVIENGIGADLADVMYGNAVANVLRGNGGSDQIYGFAGNDQIFGDAGFDLLDGGAGADQVFGGADNDTLIARAGEFVAGELYDGGADVGDELSIAGEVDLRAGSFVNFERLGFRDEGAAYNRAIVNLSQLAGFTANLVLTNGTSRQDSLQIIVPVGATADISGYQFQFPMWNFDDYVVFTGDTGGETLIGFGGLDIFFAGGGNDIMDGRGAVDFAAYIFSLDGVTADLSIQGTAQLISAQQGSDTFINIEGLAGSQLADTLRGDNGDNFLLGLHGNDTLVGRNGADDIRGGEHADRIDGGMGADTLWGGAPADTLSGPDGADTFVYHNAAEGGDTIRDFQAGVDKIELSAAGFGLTAGAAVQLVTGVNPVASGAGPQFLLTTFDGTLSFNARLFFDADGAGAGAAVLIATLSGQTVLTANDFVVTNIGGTSLGIEGEPPAKGVDQSAEVSIAADWFDFGDAAPDAPAPEVSPVLDQMPEAFADAAPLHVPADDALTLAGLQHDILPDAALGPDVFRF